MPKFSSGAAKVRRLFPAGGEIKKLVQVYAFLNFWVPGVGVAVAGELFLRVSVHLCVMGKCECACVHYSVVTVARSRSR